MQNQDRKNAMMLMYDMGNDDKELCIQLLKNVEIKFSALWQGHKGKAFEEVYTEVTGTRKMQVVKSKLLFYSFSIAILKQYIL